MKATRLYFISFLVIFLISSCKSQVEKINIINFVKQKTESIEVEKGARFFPYSYYTKDDSLYLMLNNDEKKELITYNFNTGKIEERIKIDFFRYNNLLQINYYNRDSIFLAFNTSAISGNDYHDSSFMVINNKGKIKKILDFKDTPVRCSYNKLTSSESSMVLPSVFTDIHYSNHKLFFSISKLYCKPGDSISESVKLPYAGHYDFDKDKMIIYEQLSTFPFFKQGRYYHRLVRKAYIALSDKDLPILAFRHTPLVFEYDFVKKTKQTHKIKSILVDTIKPDSIYIPKIQDIYKSKYRNIVYDKYRKQYYRFVSLAAKKDDSPFRKNHRKISMIVADTNFNVTAEGILPDNLISLSLLITEEGLWFYNTAFRENITYELFKLDYITGTKDDLIEKYNERTDVDNKFGVLSYMDDNFNIKTENSAIVIVPSDLGCHSCASLIAKFYVDNQNLFKNKKLYFVVAGLAKFTVDPFIEQNNLKNDMPNLFIDKKGEYLNYFEGFHNPKLFILENGVVKFEKVYKPAELFDLEMKIEEYSKKHIINN